MADENTGPFRDEPMDATMERVARDDYYEHRGKVSPTWARLYLHATATEMGIELSVAESEKFTLLLWALESDGRVIVNKL